MYKKDNKFIAEYCQQSADNLAFCHAGVQVTIQQNTENLDTIMTEYKTSGINIPVFNWSKKKNAVNNNLLNMFNNVFNFHFFLIFKRIYCKR